MNAMTASGGAINAVTDDRSSRRTACSPRRGDLLRAGLRGQRRRPARARRGRRAAGACVLTGHGLKDPQSALSQVGAVVPCAPEFAALERAVLE